MKVAHFIVSSLVASTTLAAAITVASAPLKFYVKYNGLLRPLYGYYFTVANGDKIYILSLGQQATVSPEFILKGSSAVTTQNYRVGLYHHMLSFGPSVSGTPLFFEKNMKLNIGPVYLCPAYRDNLLTIRVGVQLANSSVCFLVDLYLLPDQGNSEYAADEPQREPSDFQRSGSSDSQTPEKKDPQTTEKINPQTPEQSDA